MRLYIFLFLFSLIGFSTTSSAQTLVGDDIEINGNLGDFLIYPEWQSGKPHRLSFVPVIGSSSIWDSQLHLYADGRLEKRVANASDDAYVVEQDGDYNFVVKGSGMIYARGLEVTLSNFPDYVFDNDYDRMSLNDLKQFIEANNKLPKIPSAKEAAEEGVELAELSRLQMEKIEELTLYIIELHERLKSLEAQKE